MPRVTTKKQITKIEEVTLYTVCDGCGQKTEDCTSGGPIDWPDGSTTVCWCLPANDGESKELVICPNCFLAVKEFVETQLRKRNEPQKLGVTMTKEEILFNNISAGLQIDIKLVEEGDRRPDVLGTLCVNRDVARSRFPVRLQAEIARATTLLEEKE
jgi:hypothetical protein